MLTTCSARELSIFLPVILQRNADNSKANLVSTIGRLEWDKKVLFIKAPWF